jgi:DNA-binding transcriptional regulator YdaS (Cro superfamily)
MFHDVLFKAIRMIGSRKKTAKLLRISLKIVENWFTRDQRIRVEHALMLEVLTDAIAVKKGTQKINAEELAPYAATQIIAYKKMINKNLTS